jgi:hypothetical protein
MYEGRTGKCLQQVELDFTFGCSWPFLFHHVLSGQLHLKMSRWTNGLVYGVHFQQYFSYIVMNERSKSIINEKQRVVLT